MKTPSPSADPPERRPHLSLYRRFLNHLPARPTARGWLLSATAAGAVGVALVNVSLATALTAAFFAATALTALILAQFTLTGISVRRLGNAEGRAFETVELPLEIANALPWFRRGITLREVCPGARGGWITAVVPPLDGRGKYVADRPTQMLRRGSFELDRIEVTGGDPCGLFRRRKIFSLPGALRVLPAVEVLANQMIAGTTRSFSSGDGRPLGISGEGREFYGIRPYRRGDGLHSIHWRSSAARGRFMVREYEADTIDRVTLLLDTDVRQVGFDECDNNFEYLIRTATSLARHMRELYCHVDFFAFDATGALVSISHDAVAAEPRIGRFLTEIEPGREKFTGLLSEIAERITPGSVVYALSMSRENNVFRLLEPLLERECEVRMVLAPRELFPPVDRASLRRADRASFKLKYRGAIVPAIASFDLPVAKLLGSQPQTMKGTL